MTTAAPAVATAITQTHGRALRERARLAGPRGLHKRTLIHLAVEALPGLEVELVDWRRVRFLVERLIAGETDEEREAARRFYGS